MVAQVYRGRRPKASPLWHCLWRHFDRFLDVYEERYVRLSLCDTRHSRQVSVGEGDMHPQTTNKLTQTRDVHRFGFESAGALEFVNEHSGVAV